MSPVLYLADVRSRRCIDVQSESVSNYVKQFKVMKKTLLQKWEALNVLLYDIVFHRGSVWMKWNTEYILFIKQGLIATTWHLLLSTYCLVNGKRSAFKQRSSYLWLLKVLYNQCFKFTHSYTRTKTHTVVSNAR